MRCLVTGGAGFIGSHLVDCLLGEGHFVRVLDNFSTGSRNNLEAVASDIEIVEGSIEDPRLLEQAVSGIDWVFHFAAMVSVPMSIVEPYACQRQNDIAVFQLYDAARKSGVQKIIYSSSAAIYGEQPTPHHEGLCPCPTGSPYGIYKLVGEHYGRFFYKTYGLQSVSLRYFNVFGPRQSPGSPYSGVISIFMDKLSKKQPVTIHGDGMQTRDFTYVSDVARANLLAAQAETGAGESFNIATGSTRTIMDVYNTIRSFAAVEAEPVFGEARQGDIRHSSAEVDKAARELGFTASVPFAHGMQETWSWYAGTEK